MSDSQKMFVPSQPLPAPRTGVLTAFDPGTRVLEAGFQVAPPFKPLPVDIVFEKDVAVTLRDGVTIYVTLEHYDIAPRRAKCQAVEAPASPAPMTT